ncbi:hypothetical protein ALC57_12190 [Trachymyrmex cornetzi]|uniref:DUF5641 domain-containing protein n=1 Tax=Trachymyrmex cornetzi TaxID=471704 RepID=A0A151J198_9HYME|nr:hypothetical protein ALC57_12190 [Trachymyrmex cornetzi]
MFCEDFLRRADEDPEFPFHVIFSDESLFAYRTPDTKKQAGISAKTVESNVIDLLFPRRSKLRKIVRIFAYCRRFIQHLKKGSRSGGDISAEEYYSSLVELAKYSQGDSFNAEIESLARGMPITKESLASLTPFLGEDGILRVAVKPMGTLEQGIYFRIATKNKWTKPFPPLEINRLVLVKEDNLPPSKWKLGRIIEVHPGSDGTVRVASIRTSTGTVRRVLTKICPLPQDEIEAHV